MLLEKKVSFKKHIHEIIATANKGMGIIRRLFNILPRNTLVTIHKSFVRSFVLIIAVLTMTNLIMKISVIKSEGSNTMLY